MMRYKEFLNCTSLSKDQLLAISQGKLLEDAPKEFVRLPAPPLLMLDRVVSIERNGSRGRIVGEQDISSTDWFFQCHFRDDPVQPGCLGVDAVWQLLGLYCGLCGAPGSGRALGCKEVEFFGQIRPYDETVRYDVEIRRFSLLPQSGSAIAIGSARVLVDGSHIYNVRDAKVGTFPGIAYADYPARSRYSVGGVMARGEA
jgi:3-hydroxyacyl-[acyl-carrier protein] dehydratase/trans-2-decenoyl-[acyl-carrier protein] isomerase